MTVRRDFASDNNAGVHPAVLAAIADANIGHERAYGHDPYTQRAEAVFRHHFGDAAKTWLVFNGTAANVLGLEAVTEPHNAVICVDAAHINVDECGAPERFLGSKLIPLPTVDGKLRPDAVRAAATAVSIDHAAHHVRPRVISISQSSEYGTVYTPEELRALSAVAREHDLLLHMDGARLANAAAAFDAEELEEVRRDTRPRDPFGLAFADEVERGFVPRGDVLEGAGVLLERYHLPAHLRGDAIFAVGRKESGVRERYPAWLYAGGE